MKDRLAIGICGSVSSADRKYDPLIYCRSAAGKTLLFELAHAPKRKADIDAGLLEGLLLVEAVRIENGRCYLNFPLFLNEDKRMIERFAEVYARKLAAAIVQRSGEFCRIAESLVHRAVGVHKNLFILVGCACLDWRCLDVFSRHGYMSCAPKKAGGNEYSLFGHEKGAGNYKGLYWGSHNCVCGKYTHTSFGDHATSARDCFPDIFWNFAGNAKKSFSGGFENELCDAFGESWDKWGDRVAEETLAYEPAKDGRAIRLLKKLRYIKNGSVNIPVFVKKDACAVSEIKSKMDVIALGWADASYSELKNTLSGITPNRQGVDYKDTFVQIWHYVFGYANKYLARAGFIFDPYGEESDFGGYLPAIHERRLNL